MPKLRILVLSLVFVAAGSIAIAQQPGDKVEYKAQQWPEKWEVGTFLRVLVGGKQVLIRQAPSQFFPEGFERAYAIEDVRPLRTAAAPTPPLPREAPPARPLPAYTPPPPVPVRQAPAALMALAACGPRPNPERDRLECIQQVQRSSGHWGACAAGDGAACHRFVREVARALAAGDPRWGLITKPRGQQACTEQHCGRDVSGGFGEDMVAYLPSGHATNQWLGSDIVGGAGAPGARIQWSNPDGYSTNRADNLWTAVPR